MNNGSTSDQGIEHFCAGMPVSMTEHWYRYAVEGHFWMDWRLKVFARMFRSFVPQIARGLEVGAGCGVFRSQVERTFKIPVDAAELNAEILKSCPFGLGRKLVFDVLDAPPQLIGSYDVVFLMDVIEHIDEDSIFLERASQLCKPGGLVVGNVPALMNLWNRYDEVAGHKRRYTKKSMGELLLKVGLKCERLEFWGFTMIPILVVRKLLLAWASDEKNVVKDGFNPPGPITDFFLRSLFNLEHSFDLRWPAGSSLMFVARV